MDNKERIEKIDFTVDPSLTDNTKIHILIGDIKTIINKINEIVEVLNKGGDNG